MSRRLLILLLPALALVVWLVAAQIPRWTAPQPNWFAPGTPGVCAAVESLKLYGGTRTSIAGNGRDAAADAQQIITEHYDAAPLAVSEPLAVEAALPGEERRAYTLVTARLTDDNLPKIALLYLDAGTGEAQALITTTDDPAADCDFSVREALVAALKSPPLLLLIAYVLLAAIVRVARLVARRIAKGRHR